MNQMLSEWLKALGFDAMARDVLTEQDQTVLQRYARIIIKQVPQDQKQSVYTRFALLRLV
jgi:trans-aconitate methyltransferase